MQPKLLSSSILRPREARTLGADGMTMTTALGPLYIACVECGWEARPCFTRGAALDLRASWRFSSVPRAYSRMTCDHTT
jgi:hypothetical protein